MDLEKVFAARYWINLGRRPDRRNETEWTLAQAGISAERMAAVDSRFVARMSLERRKQATQADGQTGSDKTADQPCSVRGYDGMGRYALALTQRMAIRKARQSGAEAVLLFEDDVVIHPNFTSLLKGIELPHDWGIFLLGCQHEKEPTPCAPGLVRVKYACDTHAIAIRRPYFNQAMRALNAHAKPIPQHALASDRFLAALQDEIPTYACFPNLAWQAATPSDLLQANYSHYQTGGTQKNRMSLINGVYASLIDSTAIIPGKIKPKLGLLFLTRGDVNHPDIWKEFVEERPGSVEIFCHPKYPEDLKGGFLEGKQIPSHYKTAWGSISLVNASIALLHSALKDRSITHFVLLSESCVPIKPLSVILRHLWANPLSRFTWRTLNDCSELQRSRAAHLPQIPVGCWHFHPQWWLMDRLAAEWISRADYTEVFRGMPIPDEAYFGTVLSLLGYPVADRVENKDITWTDWIGCKGSPNSFHSVDGSTAKMMVESGAWFARKFPPKSDVGKWRLHKVAEEDDESVGGLLSKPEGH